MPTRFLLKGSSLRELQERAVAEFGPDAFLVSAEKITTPRVGGLLREHHYEAVIEIRDALPPVAPSPANPVQPNTAQPKTAQPNPGQPGSRLRTRARMQVPPRPGSHPESGLERLLAAAESSETRLATRQAAPVGSQGSDFASILDEQSFALEPAAGRRAAGRAEAPRGQKLRPATPRQAAPVARAAELAVRRQVGDLVLLVGLGTDAVTAAAALDDGSVMLRTTGQPDALHRPVTDRRSAMKTRAAAVAEGCSVLLADSLAGFSAAADAAERLEVLGADQLLVVVDARHKSEDTARWVGELGGRIGIHGVLVLHSQLTGTPDSVLELGYPLLRLDAAGHLPVPRGTR